MPRRLPDRFDASVPDDEPDVRVLASSNVQNRARDDGSVKLFTKTSRPSRYSLIVSDLQLPGADGLGDVQPHLAPGLPSHRRNQIRLARLSRPGG
jgi:hypothetical protein